MRESERSEREKREREREKDVKNRTTASRLPQRDIHTYPASVLK